MAYFTKIQHYDTYGGHDDDFHCDYNANSGGGQAFLGGKFSDPEGQLCSARTLEGKSASIVFRFRDSDNLERRINLGDQSSACYTITPRGTGYQSMKLSLEGKVRPNLLIPALLMLPKTCGRNKARLLSESPLTTENYWLRSMWLDCELYLPDKVNLIPRDYIFEGGQSDKTPNSVDSSTTGTPVYFQLDFERRANDIVFAADNAFTLPDVIQNALNLFKNILIGETPFDHKACRSKTAEVMSALAQAYPTEYSGISDPLPQIMHCLDAYNNRGCASETHVRHANLPKNLIFFGAPGTGKSHSLSEKARSFDFAEIQRVTFYPDYTYSQFIGCFKPVTQYEYIDDDATSQKARPYISYEFVPGPFIRTYIRAIQNPTKDYLLAIEEINRSNPAAVFGDTFQLLDRKNGCSEYEITVPKELEEYFHTFLPEYATSAFFSDPSELIKERERLRKEERRLSIPDNMYIWATMNSADQGVFPMDTAFKRRWDFEYIDINKGEDAVLDDGTILSDIVVEIAGKKVSWNKLRRSLNDLMSNQENSISEDKLLGPFFISPAALMGERFADTFKDKVLLYLYEDAGKLKRKGIFKDGDATYQTLRNQFDEVGVQIFKLNNIDGLYASEDPRSDAENPGE